MRVLGFSFALGLAACGGAQSGADGAPAAVEVGVASPATRPTGPLSRAEAERYALSLVNADRAAVGLKPLTWDETAAAAGRAHAEDMARRGFTAHVGSAGDVPEERYTKVGGEDFVMENAGCFADATPRDLDAEGRYLPEEIEKIEHAFLDEVPPNDGHRKNLLSPRHTSGGVGLALTRGLTIPCMAQELVDDVGTYQPLPHKARVGSTIRVAGAVRAPAQIAGVGLSRIDLGKPVAPNALNATHSYAIPAPFITFFPHGYKTPIEVAIDQQKGSFSIDVPLSDRKRAGRYGVSVWARVPGERDLVMVSLRTIDAE
jgi:uncharacterized protein YkwD